MCLLCNTHALKALFVWRFPTPLPRYQVPQSHRFLARPNRKQISHFETLCRLRSSHCCSAVSEAVSFYLIVCVLTPTLSFLHTLHPWSINIYSSSLISSRSKYSAWNIILSLRVERQLPWKIVLYNSARNGARAWIQTTCASFKQHSMIQPRLFRSYRKKLFV